MDTTRTTTIPNSAVAEINPLSISLFGPKSSPSMAVTSLSYWEPMLSCIGKVADAASSSHNRTHASTVNLLHGCMAGQEFYTVAIYPTRSITSWERPSRDDFFNFAKANLDLLTRPSHALESWYDDRGCCHVIEVVVCIRSLDAAVGVGTQFDLSSVFDLHARREIPIPRK